MKITNDLEYRYSLAAVADFRDQIQRIQAELEKRGLPPEAIKVAVMAHVVLADDVEWEIREYQRLQGITP